MTGAGIAAGEAQDGFAALSDWAVRHPFRPRPPWLTGDLQTLRNTLVRPWIDLAPWPGPRLHLALGDGTGDALVGSLHRPRGGGGDRPLVVLVHGLGGWEDSAYMRQTAAVLLAGGWKVLRLNLRGVGPSSRTCRLQYHAGRSEDLAAALRALGGEIPEAGAVVVGYSLGGSMLAKYLAEQGANGPVRAAAMVSSPLDLAECSRRFLAPRNRPYQRAMLSWLKSDAVAGRAELTPGERRAIATARTTWEFDEFFVAPRNGFAGAEDYYRRSSARRFLPAVRVPTVVIHALDDPWIPAEAYRSFDWAGNPTLLPVLAARGGHVGFHGTGSLVPWHDRAIAAFLGGLL